MKIISSINKIVESFLPRDKHPRRRQNMKKNSHDVSVFRDFTLFLSF